ncbi:MAG: DNA-deoxyinosine glycosylase [Lachnospiraceae bacterium]|nr:DNA-deoxyinosine glycosylase [Lachnospiraceae bacterium]
MKRRSEKHTHEFPPLFDAHSRILILGSFPSVRSREQQFYYGHPQNRFWRILAALTGEAVPENIPQKKMLALGHGMALWDVIDSCEIAGSSDSSIRNAVPTDLSVILDRCRIEKICTNGALARKLYLKYQYPETGIEPIALPSTSPANAAWSFERLLEAWREGLGKC